MDEEVEATSLGTEFWQDLQACKTGRHVQNVKVQVKFHEAMARAPIASLKALNLGEGPLCSVHCRGTATWDLFIQALTMFESPA